MRKDKINDKYNENGSPPEGPCIMLIAFKYSYMQCLQNDIKLIDIDKKGNSLV